MPDTGKTAVRIMHGCLLSGAVCSRTAAAWYRLSSETITPASSGFKGCRGTAAAYGIAGSSGTSIVNSKSTVERAMQEAFLLI